MLAEALRNLSSERSRVICRSATTRRRKRTSELQRKARAFNAFCILFQQRSNPSSTQIKQVFVFYASMCTSAAEVNRLARSVREWTAVLAAARSLRLKQR